MTLKPGDKITYRAHKKGRLLEATVIGDKPMSIGVGTFFKMAWECRKPKPSTSGGSPLVHIPEGWIVEVEGR